ncbi:MAG: sulfate adenylyltransferase, large subunit [Clostridia bacterium]|nr:sulfate adenylyltransferase, large subunit [Clostridia bacterium]
MDICNNTINIKDTDMNIVIVGHVDHGKSTVIGRLLADTNSLPEGKLEQIKEMCRRNSKPFEYAFLLDALKDERAQGITIDTARSFFKTEKRKYIIIDAPGHIEFLKNMITGASRAEAALLVIDAYEGIKENSRRHGYILSMLGIKQIVVLINKLDLIDENKTKEVFDNIVSEYSEFLDKLGVKPKHFIPISAMEGDNIANKSNKMPWYTGFTVLQALDDFENIKQSDDLPFRMPVQDVYKFTNSGDDRRIIAGTAETGRLKVGDEIMFYPSGKKTFVKSIETFNSPSVTEISAGYSTGFTMTEQIYVKRGEVVFIANQKPPRVGNKIKVSLFWLGKQPMDKSRSYILKIGSMKVGVKLERVLNVLNASSLENSKKDNVERHEVADCILHTDKQIAFDISQEIATTGRFVLIDKYEISGGGIITDDVFDERNQIKEKVQIRNFKWEKSSITGAERAEYYNQKSAMILITGEKQSSKKQMARTLEKKLLSEGKIAYYLGIGNVLYGVDADIKQQNTIENQEERDEHIRRLAEVSNIMMDAGVILIVTATDMKQADLDLIQTVVNQEDIITVWLGAEITTDIKYDINLNDNESEDSNALIIKEKLRDKGFIFKIW